MRAFAKEYPDFSIVQVLLAQKKDEPVANCDWFKNMKHSIINPYAFHLEDVR